ncbi:MAG TPA: UPF0158 family protein [Anaerolineae bacterium]|nr:UPF0158 family protein [Anaerolineae bacterium]
MKRKLKVDLNELDVALNWSMSESSHYLDLETGNVVGIDDEARRTSKKLLEEIDAEEGDELVAFEELLQQREDIQEWQKDLALNAARVECDEVGRYIGIEPDDPYQNYNDMDNFIATLDDDELQDRLWDAIRGRGAFRYFKDLIARYPNVEEQWYAYKDARAKERLLRWLGDHDIEPIT